MLSKKTMADKEKRVNHQRVMMKDIQYHLLLLKKQRQQKYISNNILIK